MKYLKRFNEELKPETYKQAGQRLSTRHGHHERGAKLSQYGHDLAGDLIGFWVGEGQTRSTFLLPLEFYYTHCKLRVPGKESIWLGQDGTYYADRISDYLSRLVSDYKEGGPELYVDIDIFFEISPRQKILMKDLAKNIQRGKSNGSESGMTSKLIINNLANSYGQSLMTLRVYLSENMYWDDDNGNYQKPTEDDIYDNFEALFSPSVFFVSPPPLKETSIGGTNALFANMYAIPCSRVEANKFKKNVMSKVVNNVKPIIHEIISEHIQGKPEHFEKAISALTNMKINNMYRDKIDYAHDTFNYKIQFVKD